MSIQDFESIIDKMQLAFEYALNLGQSAEAAKILYQMNQMLPDDLQLSFDDVDNENAMKSFVHQYSSEIKLVISEYKQRLN